MDGYKKIILTGCVALLGGYFLPWLTTLASTSTGLDALLVGLDAVRTMRALGQYEYLSLVAYTALVLPALGAVLSMIYCLVRPTGSNGSVGTVLFILPLLSLALTAAYLGASQLGSTPGDTITGPMVSLVLDSMLDLSKTGGLWLVHLGALLMALGRLGKS